jgi:hypothetical protein
MPFKKPTRVEPTLDDLVAFIGKRAKEHFERTGRGIEGSPLAYLVRHEFPELDYTKLGLGKLGDAVRVAEGRGLVKRNLAVRHLELSPVQKDDGPVPRVTPEPSALGMSFVTPELWHPFVILKPLAISFYYPSTREVVQVDPSDGSRLRELRDKDSAVEVEPVEPETQATWLKEFLSVRGHTTAASNEELQTLIRGGINSLGSSLAQDWRYLRSRKVVEHVRQWAKRNGIEESLVLVPANPESKRKRIASTVSRDGNGAAMRRAIIAAIEEMPETELEKLAIPLRYVVRYFKAR